MIVKALLDRVLSLLLFLIFLPLLILISLAIKLTSPGPAIHWSKRIGLNSHIFLMPKFRTMLIDTPDKATHLLQNPESYLTPIGGFLRKTSLDELPQLWSILKGDMSFVGPRPALFNQDDLIEQRKKLSVDSILPGLTGWAQVQGRDEISIEQKVKLDHHYLLKKSLWFDIRIVLLTVKKVIASEDINH